VCSFEDVRGVDGKPLGQGAGNKAENGSGRDSEFHCVLGGMW
jgi:hypothetical protein